MPKLPAFIHIDLKSTSELAGKLTRHIEYTSRGNSQNMQILQSRPSQTSRTEFSKEKSNLSTSLMKFPTKMDSQGKDQRS
jgi:hypothetical protein